MIDFGIPVAPGGNRTQVVERRVKEAQMIELRNILCPVDFSDFSRRALDQAMAIAHRFEATVTLLHVCPGVPAIAYTAGIPLEQPFVLTDDDRTRLASELVQFAEAGTTCGVPIEPVVREGDAVREILAEAASINADLLTLGTHGRSGFERLFLGSVTETVLREASCPVLTVPCRHPGTVPARPELFKRILCPIDFSESSMAALHYALSLAQENDAELVVVYVVINDLTPLPGQPPHDVSDYTISVADFFIRREEHVRHLLRQAVPEAARTYCSVETTVAHGKPSAQILKLADERESDLIVIGVRGRGAADRAIFGSTTQHVVRQAKCPVLTIRQPAAS
jgi:nucleotide-binding universal stress UspA family protein